jgi:Transposase DDE domain
MALRQTTGFVESLLRLIDMDWAGPQFSTLSRRGKTLMVNIAFRGSTAPLHLLIDSTCIKIKGEGQWNPRKHGGTKRRVWHRIHIGTEAKSLEIRIAKVTASDVGVAPMLPEPLGQIPPDQKIACVTADGAFDTRKCHDAIAATDAAAIIPPRMNAKPWKPDTPGAIARNAASRASRRFSRTIWRRRSSITAGAASRQRYSASNCSPATGRVEFRLSGRRVPVPCGRHGRLHRARDSRASLEQAFKERGFWLAKGDRRGYPYLSITVCGYPSGVTPFECPPCGPILYTQNAALCP